MPKKTRPLIAIINTSIEFVEALEMAMQQAGFKTIATIVPNLKNGKVTLKQLFSKKKPEVIIYDVAIPYIENWEYLQKMRSESKDVGDARFIITTTNKQALEKLIGQETHAFEITGIIDKPFDLDYLLKAVKKAVEEVQNQRILSAKKN